MVQFSIYTQFNSRYCASDIGTTGARNLTRDEHESAVFVLRRNLCHFSFDYFGATATLINDKRQIKMNIIFDEWMRAYNMCFCVLFHSHRWQFETPQFMHCGVLARNEDVDYSYRWQLRFSAVWTKKDLLQGSDYRVMRVINCCDWLFITHSNSYLIECLCRLFETIYLYIVNNMRMGIKQERTHTCFCVINCVLCRCLIRRHCHLHRHRLRWRFRSNRER